MDNVTILIEGEYKTLNETQFNNWLMWGAVIKDIKNWDYYTIDDTTLIETPVDISEWTQLDYTGQKYFYNETDNIIKIIEKFCNIQEIDYIKTGTIGAKLLEPYNLNCDIIIHFDFDEQGNELINPIINGYPLTSGTILVYTKNSDTLKLIPKKPYNA